jgi:hypothetical protein
VALLLGGCNKKTDAPEFKGTGAPAPSAGAGGGKDAGTGPGKAAGAQAAPPPAPAESFKGAGQYLPRPEVAGWKQSGKVSYYTKENLFELINGAAEQYLEYGFKELARAEYVSAAQGPGKTITVEIYEMNDPTGAYGLFSRQTASEETKPSAEEGDVAGARASLGDGQLLFFRGSYFVRVNWLDESAKADQTQARAATQLQLKPVADGVARKLPGTVTEPPAVTKINSDGRLNNRTIYYPKEVPGLGFGPGYSMTYDYEKSRWETVVMEGEASKAAMAALTKAAGGTAVPKVGDEAFSGKLADRGEVVAVRKGTWMVAVIDARGNKPDQNMPKADKITWATKALSDLHEQ